MFLKNNYSQPTSRVENLNSLKLLWIFTDRRSTRKAAMNDERKTVNLVSARETRTEGPLLLCSLLASRFSLLFLSTLFSLISPLISLLASRFSLLSSRSALCMLSQNLHFYFIKNKFLKKYTQIYLFICQLSLIIQ